MKLTSASYRRIESYNEAVEYGIFFQDNRANHWEQNVVIRIKFRLDIN